ncbi:MAG: alpha/beta hydrolase fold domain-containing protein [Planctomycetia bacterium]|nr:alpha/beta hydrolase fold domain-containing protein [Planctomycetia bacterium]
MSRLGRSWLWSRFWSAFILVAVCFGCAHVAEGASILMKDGRTLRGKVGKTSGLAENPLPPKTDDPKTITFVDDDLRRVFIPTFQIRQILEADSGEVPEIIRIEQHVAREARNKVNRVGPIVNVTKFDPLGHRTFSMMTDKGRLDVIQGITAISPVWTKVEALMTKQKPVMWDMRMATHSISDEELTSLLARRIDPKKLEQRLRVVRLYLQAELYSRAERELQAVIAAFPDEKDLAKEVQSLRQLNARRIVKEIQVRREAGQHARAYYLLENFPSQDVAGDILEQVREILDDYRAKIKQREKILDELKERVAAIKDASTRVQCEAMLKEISQELNMNTLGRMADYLRLGDDEKLGPEEKISLAFSGWLLGSNHGEQNLAVTLSLAKVRALVARYLRESMPLERNKAFSELGGLEGAVPPFVALLIANMKPPLPSEDPSVGKPGFYKLEIKGIDKEPDVTYYVQLPPEYDPYVRYPTILTLNGTATTPEQQIDWWAGAEDAKGTRQGQATRFGYIVMAVEWRKEGQKEYEFSAREHAAVLGSLRDACRRFSIDTDRVFLSGHSMGGNAAWDLGLAHPDLWAGVIPIVAQAEKYCRNYWENASLVPFYVLAGEYDGDKVIKNAETLDRYMKKHFDVTYTEYIGRGHEDFYEDIQHIFDWMSRRRPRNFFPKEFTVVTMRTWDNYFWWLEGRELPSKGMVEPTDWPPPRGTKPVSVTARVQATNGVSITTGSVKITAWLSPEIVDFSKPIRATLNNHPINPKLGATITIQPDLRVLLEDVRTRADRLHPFWAKIE